MQVPMEISYRDVQKSPELERLIQEQADKLEQVCDHVISVRLALEMPQRHQKSGNPYRVRLAIRVPPGHEIVVKREPGEGDMHQELPALLRDVFEAARRQCRQLTQVQRGDTKTHPEQQTMALVARLFPEEGYGFLRELDGREVYFHRNSVVNDAFDELQVGTGVRLIVVEGEKGPQASTVQVVDQPPSQVEEKPEGWTAE